MAEVSNDVFHRPSASPRPTTSGDDGAPTSGTPLAVAIQAAASDTVERVTSAPAVRDAVVVDVVVDAAEADAGEPDAGEVDAGEPNAGEPDDGEAAVDHPAAEADGTGVADPADTLPADSAASGAPEAAAEDDATEEGEPAEEEDSTPGVAEGAQDTVDAEPADASRADASHDGAGQDDAEEEAPMDGTEPAGRNIDGADAVGGDQDGGAEAVARADAAAPSAETGAAGTRPSAHLRGDTTVSDGVVTKLVNAVAARVEGVHALDGAGVEVVDDVATITVSFVAEYGSPIRPVATRVRTDVIEAAEGLLDLDVEAVHVTVSDLHTPDPA
ncbi:Asp23/Gls24 family envelope stress response protein [Myceligenerans pegani]|uniref:Asp23/Gls24 family envelope stress response protein n=1 Tax=Myceligenerans pegani TaxID=2776917 RepID=A0ABR9MXV5_9MICO|nr:Asp23/Gls24 family envelope stress response protein [Myceligenerans sp. TRM 65318]MBE1876215.1 Asp23/Gls24 family envelope stress response protein [Myceligenerans sp. TRM 65318]MBE3018486.1 Asp23/Gls24 family envelope stress response protein [Myceligenerans sp. TRM 65318]